MSQHYENFKLAELPYKNPFCYQVVASSCGHIFKPSCHILLNLLINYIKFAQTKCIISYLYTQPNQIVICQLAKGKWLHTQKPQTNRLVSPNVGHCWHFPFIDFLFLFIQRKRRISVKQKQVDSKKALNDLSKFTPYSYWCHQ